MTNTHLEHHTAQRALQAEPPLPVHHQNCNRVQNLSDRPPVLLEWETL